MPEYIGEIKAYNEYIEWHRKCQIVQNEINAEIARLKRFLEIILNRGFKRILVIGLRLVY